MSIYNADTEFVLSKVDEPYSSDADIEATAALLTRRFKKIREESREDVVE